MQKKKKSIRISICSCLFATALLCGGCANDTAVVIETADGAKQEELRDTGMQTASQENPGIVESDEKTSVQEAETIYVQVNGAVNAPGVYPVEEGSRVFEVIEKAGGMTAEAAAEALNQAAVLSDGQVITVYTYQEWEEIRASGDTAVDGDMHSQDDGRVNINTADLNTLCTIPGIGATRAEHIISYRNENGPFDSVEDIKKVSGIKDGLFEQIKDLIKV